MPGTDTVTPVLARPSAATSSVPEGGSTVMPPEACAVHFTVVAFSPVPCAPTVTWLVSPAVTVTGPEGSVNPMAGSWPVWYDGGASCGPVAQLVSGVLDRLKSSWPPRVATDSGSAVLVKVFPFSCTPVTYGVLSPAAGALMLIAPPLPRWTTACWNSGLPRARWPVRE